MPTPAAPAPAAIRCIQRPTGEWFTFAPGNAPGRDTPDAIDLLTEAETRERSAPVGYRTPKSTPESRRREPTPRSAVTSCRCRIRSSVDRRLPRSRTPSATRPPPARRRDRSSVGEPGETRAADRHRPDLAEGIDLAVGRPQQLVIPAQVHQSVAAGNQVLVGELTVVHLRQGDGGDGSPAPPQRTFGGMHVSPRNSLRDHESGRRAGHRRSSAGAPVLHDDAGAHRLTGMIRVRTGLTRPQWYRDGTSRPNAPA